MSKKLGVILVLFALLFTVSIGPVSAEPVSSDKALSAAEKWLSLVDAGLYAESWDKTSSYFKGVIKKDDWQSSLKGIREPLGKLVSRKKTFQQFMKTLPGAPDGQYVVIQYSTSFSNKASSTETVTSMLDNDGVWRVGGYYLK